MSDDQIDRKIAVIFATDVVGYSKSMEQDEAQTIKNLRACRRLLDKSFKQYDGRIFNTAGDSVLAEFSSAVLAVECAADFQRVLKQRNQSSAKAEIMEFRIGINMGDVVIEDGNLYGDGVNIAARLEALAQPNGISISKPVYEFVQAKTDLVFNDLGVQQVKENRFHVYDVVLDPSQKRSLSKPLSSKLPMVAAAIAVIAIIGGGLFFWSPAPSKQEPEQLFSDSKAIKMIVNEFRSLAGGEEAQGLSEGLTRAVQTTLNNYDEVSLPPAELRADILSDDRPDMDLMRRLNIAYQISGTVQISDQSARVTVNLIDNLSEKIIWSQNLDFARANEFGVQDEVANEVLASTMTKVTMGEDAALDRELFSSAENFLTFMNWRSNFLKRTQESFIRAEKLERKLLQTLPDTNVYYHLVPGWMSFAKLNRKLSTDKTADRSRLDDSMQKALAVNPGYAQNLVGLTALFLDRDCKKASHHINKFVEAGKNANRMRQAGYVYVQCGMETEAIDTLNVALRLEPNAKNDEIKTLIIAAHMLSGDVANAITVAENFVSQGLRDITTRRLMAYLYLLNDDLDAAKKMSPDLADFDVISPETIDIAARACGTFCVKKDIDQASQSPEDKADDLVANLPVVLVRPLKNLTKTTGNNLSISDSVTETLLIGLQRYEEIVTLSSSTSYHVVEAGLNNQDIKELYDVDYVVGGTVQQSGKAIRVTAELIDLATERVRWAKKFDFLDENLFEAQDQIGDAILSALQIKAVMGEQPTFHKESATAYTIILNTRRHLRTLTKDGWARADDLLRELLASDASEHAKLEMSVWHRVVRLFVGLSEDKSQDLADIISFSDRSLEINPNAASHATRAFVEANIFKNCEKALYHAEQLKPLARSGSDYQFMGLAFTNCGELTPGIAALDKSLQLTPNDTDLRITKNLMSAFLLADRFDEAIELGERSMQRQNAMVYTLLAYAEAKIGDREKARRYIYQQLDFANAVNQDSFYQQMAAINEKEFLDRMYVELTDLGLPKSK